MKKVTLLALGLISTSLLGAQLVQAEEGSVTANANSTVVLTADDGDDEGELTGPGGGKDDEGVGTITPPDGGEGGEGGVVNPGQKNPLRISLVSAFDFGTIKMSGNTETYKAALPTPNFVEGGKQARPNFVQVTDNRGSLEGWNLTAKIAKQFTNGVSTLDASTITLSNAWAEPAATDNAEFAPTVPTSSVVLEHGDAKTIATAATDKGMGTWNILYGTLNQADKSQKGDAANSVELTIPGKVKKTVGAYQAEVLWTLTNTPTK
ncbi:WxL domain-containing protein [uncultured Vagococcus sp.]|uniref:WxL domain-containing protein n=1 Tax=uncultured Vagococcus sp. TaxID=189676 RepID=UPI0028D8FE47|nr:WxL domain-containing protein [uncultured Vagococcus sp.]